MTDADPTAVGFWRGPLAPLRHRNYRLFWFGQIVSVTGTWVQSVAQGWLIARLADPTGTSGQAAASWYLGLVGVAGNLPILCICLVGGVLADRMDKRRLIMGTQAVMMVCALTMAALIALDVVRIWHVMALAACLGTATAFDLPARQSFVVEMVGKDDLGGAVALNSTMFNTARMIGPAITGFLLAANVSIATCFLLNGLSFLAVIFGLSRMRMPSVRRAPADARLGETIREGLAYVRGHTGIRRILVVVGAFGTFAFSYNVLLPAFVRYSLVPGLPESVQARAFGTLESVRGMGALAGAITVATLGRRGLHRRLMVFGAIGAAVGLMAFASTRSLPPALAAIAFVSFAFVCCFASCNTLVQMQASDVLRGRVMSVYVLLFTGTAPVGSLLAGALARAYGAPLAIRSGVLIAVAIVAVVVAWELLARRRGAPSTG